MTLPTTTGQLNQARLSVQQTINQTKTVVTTLETKVAGGATWNEINTEWNKTSSTLTTTSSTLTNLSRQNDGLTNDPGQIRLTQQLARNSLEVTRLQGQMSVVQKSSYSNLQISDVRKNISKDSAGVIAENAAIGSEEFARTFSPIGNREIIDEPTGTTVIPVLTSQNKPTNARKAELSGIDEAGLGDAKGSGTTSTAGGGRVVTTSNEVNSRANASTSTGQITNDDAAKTTKNSVGNASQSVEGRTVVPEEFIQTIVPSPNKLSGLASQTYSISLYLMNLEEYVKLLGSDKKTLPSQQLILQSGGAPFGQRNKHFDLDFYIENLEIDTVIGSQGSGSPHNAVGLKFQIMEPQGITFLPRLTAAVREYSGPDETVNCQNYLMVIRFYGYDEFGNLVSNAQNNGGETTSDPSALVEKFIPFQFNNITYKLNDQAVVYDIDGIVPALGVGYSTARGSIPFNFQLTAPDVQTLLNGNTQLQAEQAAAVVDSDDDEQQEVAERTPAAKKIGLTGRTVTQGLTTALNQHQTQLAKVTEGYIPDVYIIEMEDVPGLIDAKMKKQGKTDKSRAPGTSSDNVNQRLNQKTQNLDTDSKQYSVTAGTQIVQLIDQVMKNSTYVTAQQTVAFDEITNKKIQNTPVSTVQWYRITQTAKPLKYDKSRNDYAYEIKYRISRYQINTPRSPYFPDAMYRGTHKLYEYWFTGLNTEVISFEIENNSNYLTALGLDGLQKTAGDARFVEKKFFETAPNSSTQGGKGNSTRPAAQLASRLYDPADLTKSTIDIVGDPDWILQSELFYTTSNLSPFEPDGSINANASEVLYEIRFNRVVDYDMATGLTPNFENNMAKSKITGETNLAQESLVFTCFEVLNSFKEGKFTQKLEGTIRTFDSAVDSPAKIAEQKNEVAKKSAAQSKPKVESVRPSKVPVGSKGNGQYLDQRGRNVDGPKGTNTPPGLDAFGGAGPKVSEQKSSPIVPYTSATVNNATTRSIAQSGPRVNVDDMDGADISASESNWQPPVGPKPGSNTISDDAGTRYRGDF